jgi:molybdopterin synthase catalytic subunit
MEPHISIQTEDFDVGEELDVLPDDGSGALASFVGLVRGGDGLTALTLEHYPGMTEAEIARHVADAQTRWRLQGVTVIHRVGRLTPGARIVLVAVASSHRKDAFAACEFLMDYLKTSAPFWKYEERDGAITWVEAKQSDDEAMARWRR